MRSLSRALAAALFVATISSAGSAAAGDTSTAEHLFQQGLDAMKRNDYKAACDDFAGSNEADPSPGTEINLALCNEKQNNLASAWGWYRTAGGLAEQRGQKDRAELARAEAAKIEPKIHKLNITVKVPVEGLAVTRDGAAVPHAVLGTDVPMDPGDYKIEVTAKGKKPWHYLVHIAAGPGVEKIEVPALDDAPVETAAGVDRPPPPGSDTPPPAPAGRDGSKQRTIGFVLGGAGIVAGIVAIAVEFLALREDDKSKTNAADAVKTGADAPSAADKSALNLSAQSHHDAAKSDEVTAVVLGAGAVVLIGVGVTMILTAPSGPAKAADLQKTRIVPLLGHGTTGLGLVGTF
jgi:hypothetical protein